MQKLFTFPLFAVGRPVQKHRASLRRRLSAATPWFDDLTLPLAHENPSGRFQATLWGSNEPWKMAEGLNEILCLSGQAGLQDPELESLFPLAMRHLIRLRRSRALARQLPYPAKKQLTVLFPAFGSAWNETGAIQLHASNHARLNDHAYRTAKAFALVIPRGRARPWLGAGSLYPIDGQGRDVPQGRHVTFLQIHR